MRYTAAQPPFEKHRSSHASTFMRKLAELHCLAVTCSTLQGTTSQVHAAPDLLQAAAGTLEVEDMPTVQLDGWTCPNLLTAYLAVILSIQRLLLPCAAAPRRLSRAPLKGR